MTTPVSKCYLCVMKTKFHFTRGEWAAAFFLLSVMTAGNIFYFAGGFNPKPLADIRQFESRFRDFADEQRRLGDSLEALRKAQVGCRPAIRSDTLPPFRGQGRKPMYDIARLDLNSCDTDALVTVPQFGSKRAAKLVEYRDKLGGFHSFSQLLEIYVMQNVDTAKLKTYLYINGQNIRKLNVNTATYRELVSHPYFDAYLVKLILRHREKSGPIRDLEELQRITHAYPELVEKLRPYLEFGVQD